MLKNYFVVAFRALRRDRVYTLLNGIGLAVSLACCLLVGLFVRAEHAVDDFHPHPDRLRAVWANMNWSIAAEPSLHTPEPLAEALEGYAAVERAVVIGGAGVMEVRLPGRSDYFDLRVTAASDGFLDLFGYRLLRGDLERVFREPGVVLQESAARALFGDGEALGQTVRLERWRDTLDVAVTGILADFPARTEIGFGDDGFVTYASLPPEDSRMDLWRSTGPYTYLRLAPGRTDADLDPVFEAVATEHYAEAETPPAFGAVPVADLHLSALSPAKGFRGSAGFLRLFGAVALFVLLLGVINYVNLATAQTARRAREVGVRKTLGAGRGGLAAQFLTESVLLALIAGGAAVALAAALRAPFNTLFGADLAPGDLDVPFVLAALGLAVTTGLVAGLYPALVLARQRPVTALSGSSGRGRPSTARLRQTLIVVQLVIAIGLLGGTGVVLQQLEFAQTSDPGYDASGLVAVDLGGARLSGRWEAAVQALQALPDVEDVAGTREYPTRTGGLIAAPVGGEGGPVVTFNNMDGEPGYLRVLGARLLAGRLLDERDAKGAIVLNETAVHELGWTAAEATGERFLFNGRERTVVGVVADQHVDSFREPIGPVMVGIAEPWGDRPLTYGRLLVRLRPGALASGVEAVRAALLDLGTEAPPEVEFLDEAVAGLYEAERRLGGVLGAFAGIAVVLACLGLFGLAAYTAQRRTKEIGVRKVLGASVASLVALLSREFVALVLVAFVVAAPVAYLALGRWLDGFAYRVDLGPGVFLLAGGLALVTALATVSVHAVRAANADPVKSLRYE
jgi:putative ABC transport system permease protein